MKTAVLCVARPCGLVDSVQDVSEEPAASISDQGKRWHMSAKTYQKGVILGAFAKLREATLSFIIPVPVCPSVRIEQLGSYWTDFHEI